MAEGFLLVDKPGGWTSHDVVARCRRLLGERRIGLAGTLDPMATGLLVLGLGRATRLLRFVQDLPKTYLAVAVLGVATDTLDADGAVLDREPGRAFPALFYSRPFQIGFAQALMMLKTGASWNASVPTAARGTWPQITIIGIESAMASRTGVTVLVAPGPEVTSATPTLPVTRE